jgi:hypothetical protein
VSKQITLLFNFFVQSNMKDMGLPDIYKVIFEISLIKENDVE